MTPKKRKRIIGLHRKLQKKLANLVNRKRAISERYISEEIEFDEYKNLVSISNKKIGALDSELYRAKSELSTANESPSVAQEDIIFNFKENWDYLNNSERMMFLQRFIKKIVIRVEKENAKSNTVIIEKLEFYSLHESSFVKSQKTSVSRALNKSTDVR